MPHHFFEKPILNSPYAYPARHWELDPDGQPTDKILESRRRVMLMMVCDVDESCALSESKKARFMSGIDVSETYQI